MNSIVIGAVIVAVACGGFCAFIAKSKNRDSGGWFLLGLLFSVFALIAIAAVPALERKAEPSTHDPTQAELEREAIDGSVTKFILIMFGVLLVAIVAAVIFITNDPACNSFHVKRLP